MTTPKSELEKFVMSEVNAPPDTKVLFVSTGLKDANGNELISIAKISDIQALIHTETQRAVEAEAERTLKWMNERERPAEELIAGQEDYVKTLKATLNQKEES